MKPDKRARARARLFSSGNQLAVNQQPVVDHLHLNIFERKVARRFAHGRIFETRAVSRDGHDVRYLVAGLRIDKDIKSEGVAIADYLRCGRTRKLSCVVVWMKASRLERFTRPQVLFIFGAERAN